MNITKETVQDKLEVIGAFKYIQIRTATIIKEDGVEISRSYHRHIITPDSDSSNESENVRALVKQFHTDAIKQAYAKHLENNKPLVG
jgi:hypothetical protein|tara:strand:- start:427 stop:687 length:261 start_codon:yes stop_codon:yes gene_type:complete